MNRLLHQYGLAARLSTTAAQVEALITSGQLPVVSLPNGESRIDPADVELWITRSKRTTPPPTSTTDR